MEENLKEQDQLINEKLKFYGRFSRRNESKNNNNLNNKVYGYRKGESIIIQFDSNNNPILINKDGLKLIDSIKKYDYFEESDIDIDINSKESIEKNEILKKKRNRISDSESEISHSNENKKYKNNNKKNKNNSNKKKEEKKKENENKEIKKKCPICNFEFFSFLTENEMNEHINACLDGNGDKNIKQILKTKDIIEQQIILKKEEENNNCCPICHRIYKNLQQHAKYCINKNFASDDEE